MSKYRFLFGLVYLMGFQLFMGYLMLKLDTFLNDYNHNYVSNIPLHFFYLSIIICLHTVTRYQLFISNTNNLHKFTWLKIFQSNTNNSYAII